MAFGFASWAVSLHNYLWGNKSECKCIRSQMYHAIFQLVDKNGGKVTHYVVRFVSKCIDMNYIQL